MTEPDSNAKLPLTVPDDAEAKSSSARADEDSIVLKLNSESDAEPDSPQPPQPSKDEAAKKPAPEASEKNGEVDPKDRKKSNYLWVSNIKREVKAADLKALFAKVGRVCTAKILTNGKSFFGYVSMESHEVTLKCVKEFDNTLLDGVCITVSKTRPDLTAPKPEVVNKRVKKKEDEDKPAVADKPKPKPKDEQLQKTVATMRKRLEELTAENTRLKRRSHGQEKRHIEMRNKCFDLEQELKKLKDENREERRNLNQDRQDFERDRKLTVAKLKADREAVAKNLDEVRKLKERLKFAVGRPSPPNAYKQRDRSPPPPAPMKRASRNLSPAPKERHGGKRSRHDEYAAAPPAPKLAQEARKRYGDAPSSAAEFRHKAVEAGQWASSYSKEARGKPAGGYPVGGRYGSGSLQAPASAIVATRSFHQPYYQQW